MTQSPALSPACQQAQSLVGQGRAVDAYQLLERAAAVDGDADAAFVLAHWRMSGALVRRDLSIARDYFGRATQLGHDDAFGPFLALLASGAGGATRYWPEVLAILRKSAEKQPESQLLLSLIEAMALTATGDPASLPPLEAIAQAPDIRIARNFLSRAECDYLRRRAIPQLQPSVTVHPVSGEMMPDPIRTSFTAAFPFIMEDPVIHAINRRIAALSGTGWDQGEPTQILRYRPGEEYRLHNDALPHTDNQRVLTLLVYLNDDYRGGATVFPDIQLAHRGGVGDAILFRNVDGEGRPDPASRHGGETVSAGEKFILSKWIRARPLDISGPPGRPL